MIKQKAIELLDDTFSHDFEINRFSRFVKELLNEFDLNVQDKTSFIAKKYEDYIESLEKLGDWKDRKGKEIEVFVVKLKKASSRDRARTMQRDFIANLLEEKDAALVAFYGEDPQDWRFSYVKMEYNLVKGDSGKSKPVRELTPAKRYSFLVGVNEPNHTCASRFLKLIMEEDIDPSLEEIEQAFSVEKVTKEFFEKYKELYLRLEESLQKVIKKDSKVKREFENNGIETVDFTKKLLGQIVFLYFLQKKGWLGVEKGDDGKFKAWGTGPKDFMKRLFKGEIRKYTNFFNDILEPLFYSSLAIDRTGEDDYDLHFKCKIPFLNGGLFEPINDYNWKETDILIDNEIFENIFKRFDEFNFTVKEDEPLEKEVAVDPEMLGKVFENLLEVKDRKSKGAFYTPREIVHYMCQQSLINYLETNTSIKSKDIENFILNGDNYLALTLLYESKNINTTSEWTLPKSIKENYKEIDRLLKEIKIVDPAVGSGAFPVGMMNEIVKARSILSIYFKENRNDYDLKRETIENCLYGVDIEPSAVEITKLRFWLSLIVDELDMKNIKPLPNLDHKIMCGNSLLEEFEGVKLFDERLLGEVKKDPYEEINNINKEINELYNSAGDKSKEIKSLENKKKRLQKEMKKDRETQQITLGDSLANRIKESKKKLSELNKLQKQFFNEQNKKVKKQLRENIDRIEWELIEETLKEQGNEEAIKKLEQIKKSKSKPFFLWKLYFAEVFQRDNPGFDVVIANPPYVKNDELEESDKKYFKKEFTSAVSHYDLYIIFYEMGLKIIRNQGNLAYITSNKWLAQKYGLGLRNLLLKNKIIQIIDFNNRQIFDTATVDTEITLLKKENLDKDYPIKVHYHKSNKKINFNNLKLEEINTKLFRITSEINFKIDFTTLEAKLVEKILNRKESIQIDDICYITLGAVIHCKEGQNKKEEFLRLKFDSNLKPYLEGKDVQKWIMKKASKFLDYKPQLHREARFEELFENEKLVCIRTSSVKNPHRFALDNGRYIGDSAIIAIKYNLIPQKYQKPVTLSTDFNYKYLISLLNSRLFLWMFFKLFSDGLHYYPRHLKNTKVPILKMEQQKPFIELVDQILSITKDDDYLNNSDKQAKVKKLEKEIDQLVYKLYELTSEEIKIVEGFEK